MPRSSRMLRVNELLRRELNVLLRTKFQAEAVGLTITDVETSADTREARVFYSVLGGELQRVEAAEWFERRGRQLRFEVGQRITLRHTPELRFRFDEGMERAHRVHAILGELEEAERRPKAAGPGGAAPAAGGGPSA